MTIAVLPEGKQIILLSTDISLSVAEILTAYSCGFKIEVTFGNLIQLLSSFSYQFWMKDITPTQGLPKDLILSRYLLKQQQQFHKKSRSNGTVCTHQRYSSGCFTTT